MGKLLEKYGIKEFDNDLYLLLIDSLSISIYFESVQNITYVDFDGLEGIDFKLYSISFGGILSWLNKLQIYVTTNIDFYRRVHGECITITYDCGDTKYYSSTNGYVSTSTIFMYKDVNTSVDDIKVVLYHELAHIFYDAKSKNTFYGDLAHSLEYRDRIYFNTYLTKNNSKNISAKTTYELIKIIMYFANLSEKHAFVENANFEISYNFKNLPKDIDLIGMFDVSETLKTFGRFKNNLEILKGISEETKQRFDSDYGNVIKEVYGKNIAFDKLVELLLKRITHAYKQMCNLYNHYKEAFEKSKKEMNLSEHMFYDFEGYLKK